MERILVVDDDPAVNECMLEMLGELGYEMKGALSGADCLAILDSHAFRPDIVLLDIMMEPMDGWETLKGIRERKDLATIPVIMVTGKVPTADELDEFASMINGYLIKPFAMQFLGKEVESIIKCIKRRDEILHRARTEVNDITIIDEFFRLLCSIHIMEQLSASAAKAVVDPIALAREKHRLEELRQRLPSMGMSYS